MHILKSISILIISLTFAIGASISHAINCSVTKVKITNNTTSKLDLVYPSSTTHGKWTSRPKKVPPRGGTVTAVGMGNTVSTYEGFQSHIKLKQASKLLCKIKLHFRGEGVNKANTSLNYHLQPSKSFCKTNGVTADLVQKGLSCSSDNASNGKLDITVNTPSTN